MFARSQALEEARLYLVCDAQPDAFLHSALVGGVDVVQLRMKEASEEEIIATARRFAAICAEHGAPFILNDRPDLAALVEADGVHVGQDDVSVAEARAIVGPDRLVGLSTHSPEQIDAAGANGDSAARPDYIGVGPVYATPTKPGRPAVGLELVRYAASHAAVPFFAIGGISPDNVAEVRGAGARRVAVVRALTQARDPRGTATQLRQALSAPAHQETPTHQEVGVGST